MNTSLPSDLKQFLKLTRQNPLDPVALTHHINHFASLLNQDQGDGVTLQELRIERSKIIDDDDDDSSLKALTKDPKTFSLLQTLLFTLDVRPEFLTAELIPVIHSILSLGISVNEQDEKGYSLLHMAALKGDTQLIEFLIHHQADVNLPNKTGNSPFLLAIQSESFEAVQMLLPLAQRDLVNQGGDHAIHMAAALPDSRALELLFQPGDELRQNSVGYTPLYYAMPETASAFNSRFLMEQGSDVHHESSQKTGLLHSAIRTASESTITLLLEHGANPNALNQAGLSPFHLAITSQRTTLGTFEKLLQHGANLMDLSPTEGTSLLNMAILAGNLSAADFLLRQGLDVNGVGSANLYSVNQHRADRSQKTPIHTALEVKSVPSMPMLELLIKHGVDLNHCNDQGETALHVATGLKSIPIMTLFLDHGADLQAPSTRYHGGSSLHIAAEKSSIPMIHFLLERGADINGQNDDGDTALHKAIYHNDLTLVKLLVEQGASLTIKNRNGLDALGRAIHNLDQLGTLLHTGISNKVEIKNYIQGVSQALLEQQELKAITASLQNAKPSTDHSDHQHPDQASALGTETPKEQRHRL